MPICPDQEADTWSVVVYKVALRLLLVSTDRCSGLRTSGDRQRVKPNFGRPFVCRGARGEMMPPGWPHVVALRGLQGAADMGGAPKLYPIIQIPTQPRPSSRSCRN